MSSALMLAHLSIVRGFVLYLFHFVVFGFGHYVNEALLAATTDCCTEIIARTYAIMYYGLVYMHAYVYSNAWA